MSTRLKSHLNPGLSRCWTKRGERVIVPSAGQNRRLPVFGALDAMSGEVSVRITQRKRSAELPDFLRWLLDGLYAGHDHLYRFLDHGSIHPTRAVAAYPAQNRHRLTVIWNSPYAPNLNLTERFWGHLKRCAIHNYDFPAAENLQDAIMKAVNALNRNPHHPLRLILRTVQSLPRTA